MGSDPSYPDSQTHILELPFQGLVAARRGISEQGYLFYVNQMRFNEGYLTPIPGLDTDDSLDAARADFVGADEDILGVIPGQSRKGFYIVTENQVLWFSNTGSALVPLNVITGTGTITDATTTAVTGSGTIFLTELLAGAYIRINSGGTARTVNYANTDTTVYTTNIIGAFTGAYRVYYVDLSPTTAVNGSIGPRWCFNAGRLVLATRYGLLYQADYGPGNMLTILTAFWRGVDVVSFAGRPVLLGATYAATGWVNISTASAKMTNLIAWPTRSDMLDWTNYGSGELELLDDGAGILCGGTWGKEVFVFTETSIYQLQETGQGAGNPIAAIKLPINNYAAPTSNVVTGQKGMYYQTLHGPRMFDGRQVIPISHMLERYAQTPPTLGASYGWYNPIWETIHFHNSDNAEASKYYIQEEPLGIGMIDPTYSILSGAGWDGSTISKPYALCVNSLTGASDPILARMAETTKTIWLDGDVVMGQARWVGIAFPEGPHLRKSIKKIFITYAGGIATQTLLKYDIAPDGTNNSFSDMKQMTLATVGGSGLTTISLDPVYYSKTALALVEPGTAAIWEFAIQIPAGIRLYSIVIDYNVAGNMDGGAAAYIEEEEEEE